MMNSDKELAELARTLARAAKQAELVEANKATARKMLEALMLTHSISSLRSEVCRITRGKEG